MLYEPDRVHFLFNIAYGTLIILYIVWVTCRVIDSGWNLRLLLPDLFLSTLIICMVFSVMIGSSIISFRMVVSLLDLFFKTSGISKFVVQIRLNPARLLLLSFICVITVGILLLMLPAATVDSKGANFVDAVFTSTSATCVTGLIVKDTGSYFSGFGKVVILVLIQIGGLGIMTLSTLFAIVLGKRLSYKHEEHLRGILDQTSSSEFYKLIVKIISITLFFEFFGAILLYVKWISSMGSEEALKSAVFHSVSAFCNAGFSLNSNSLSAYAGDLYVNSVFIVLIVFGGIGFLVINDVMQNSRKLNPFSIRWSRLTVHSRLVIITTVFLIISGTISFFFFEFNNTMRSLSIPNKLMASLFQSVTARTAGFNTINTSGLKDVTLFICILLMFVGASPASTGGGIKTTTFAIFLLSVRSILKSRDEVELFGRTIPHQMVFKSIAIIIFSFTFIVVFGVLLLATQPGAFIDILFETVSAIGTVGLSTGITGKLDCAGKIFVAILMFIGRVGPLTVALALGETKRVNVKYPTTRIAVG